MPGSFILLLIVFVGLAIVIGALSHASTKRRQMELATWAHGRGWHYTPGNLSTIEDRFPEFQALRQGSNRYGYNVMRGMWDRSEAWGFDYHYETHSTNSKGHRQTHHHHFSAVIVDSGLRLTPLTIRAESFLDKLGAAFGVDDIDFESAEFSRKFWVKSSDRRWAYEVLTQETMEFLLHAPHFTLEFAGRRALARRGGRFKPGEFAQALEVVGGVLQRIPADVQAERRRPPELGRR